VICFNCPNCGRHYELLDAMSHLPLLCKGCGQRIDVPDPTPDPPPIKDTESFAAPAKTPIDSTNYLKDKLAAESLDNNKVALDLETSSDIYKKKALLSESVSTDSNYPDEESERPLRPRPLSIVVDVILALFLLIAGGIFGEVLAKKSTGDVWREAGSAPKFPPIDLLLWLTPPLLLGLIYVLLISRRKSLGFWLQRRSES
jgi:hypothetical protein